jgi:hypothetical protein
VRWTGLHGSAAALALAEAARQDDRPWLVIEPDSRSLERRRAELGFFVREGLPVLTLPDWEVLPWDLFSPLPDIVSERLRTLAELPGLRRGLVLVTLDTLLQRLAPSGWVAARSFDLAVGDTLALEAFRMRLIEAGYASVAQVGAPGEFAVRGSLLDVFPMGTEHPLRIDLFVQHLQPRLQRPHIYVGVGRLRHDGQSRAGFARTGPPIVGASGVLAALQAAEQVQFPAGSRIERVFVGRAVKAGARVEQATQRRLHRQPAGGRLGAQLAGRSLDGRAHRQPCTRLFEPCRRDRQIEVAGQHARDDAVEQRVVEAGPPARGIFGTGRSTAQVDGAGRHEMRAGRRFGAAEVGADRAATQGEAGQHPYGGGRQAAEG